MASEFIAYSCYNNDYLPEPEYATRPRSPTSSIPALAKYDKSKCGRS